MNDLDFMKLAIAMARQSADDPTGAIPRVGAVIAQGSDLVSCGWRGPEIHAEKNALDSVSEAQSHSQFTVYTTLEPCTGAVRSKPLEACTNLLTQARVEKVFIGMLDPNQGVCGKGLLELQKHKIEVELFPNDLMEEIRQLNAAFIRTQESLGLQITSPESGAQMLKGIRTVRCTFVTPPGEDIFVMIERKGHWWPQPHRLRRVGGTDEYTFDVHFGARGEHTIHVVRASKLGAALISYYKRLTDANVARREMFEDEVKRSGPPNKDLWLKAKILLGNDYPGIPLMPELPRGLDSQGHVTVEIVEEPPQLSGPMTA